MIHKRLFSTGRVSGTRTVPRLYIPSSTPTTTTTDLIGNVWNNATIVPLPLSSAHYLENVLRIPFPTKMNTNRSSGSNLIRIFNPRYGEWLGRIVPFVSSSSSSSHSSASRKSVRTTSTTLSFGQPPSSPSSSSSSFLARKTKPSSTKSDRGVDVVSKWGIQLDQCLRPSSNTTSTIKSNPIPWLFIPPLKPTRQHWLIEKASELNMVYYAPLVTAYSEQMMEQQVKNGDIGVEGSLALPTSLTTDSNTIPRDSNPSESSLSFLDAAYIVELTRWRSALYRFRTELRKIIPKYTSPLLPPNSSFSSYRYKQVSLADKSFAWGIEACEQCERLDIPYLYTEGITIAELLWITLGLMNTHSMNNHNPSHHHPQLSSSSTSVPSFELVQLLLTLTIYPLSIRGQLSLPSSLLLDIPRLRTDTDRTVFFQETQSIIRSIFRPLFCKTNNKKNNSTANANVDENISYPVSPFVLFIADEITVEQDTTNASDRVPFLTTAYMRYLEGIQTNHPPTGTTTTQTTSSGLVCGPEGGWHTIERQLMMEIEKYINTQGIHQHMAPLQRVQLSKSILRTETAVISSLTIFNNFLQS